MGTGKSNVENFKTARQSLWRKAFNHATKLSWVSCIWMAVINLGLTPVILAWTFGTRQSLHMIESPAFERLIFGAYVSGTLLTIAICHLWRWVVLNAGPASPRTRSVIVGVAASYLLFGVFAWLGEVLAVQLLGQVLLPDLFGAWSFIILEPWANSATVSTSAGANMHLNELIFDTDYVLAAAVIFVLI